jgi:phosphate uptake regulator
MIRKLVRHGPSTLIVSLPAKWVKQKGLKEKDEVYVTEEDNYLVIGTDRTKTKESIEMDITNLDRTSVVLLMHSIYRAGYSSVRFTFQQPETTYGRTQKKVLFSEIIHTITNRLIGFEVSKETNTSIEISEVSYIDKEEVDKIITRCIILLKDMVESFTEGLKNNDRIQLTRIESKHDSITKLISYLIRAITRDEYSHRKAAYPMTHILAEIDKIIDIIKYIAREEKDAEEGVTKKIHTILDSFFSSFKDFEKLFWRYDEKLIAKISSNRDILKRKVKEITKDLSEKEIRITTNLIQALELQFDLLEWRMHLHIVNKD